MYDENLKSGAAIEGAIREQAAKQRAEKSYYGEAVTGVPTAPTILGMANRLGDNQCCRVSIAEEIAGRIHHTRERSNELSRLQELAALADANPGVLRIIELMRDLNLLH